MFDKETTSVTGCVRPMSPIDTQVDALQKGVEMLFDLSERINSQLSPVLSHSAPSGETGQAKQLISCPLEERLADVREKLESLYARMNDIHLRIQL